jgi:ABC-2 type transport system permease protein
VVRHFVRLKLRILANRLRTQPVVGTIGYLAIWAAGVLLGILGGLAVFALGRLTGQLAAVLIITYTLVFAGWVVIPASTSALDETLDPRRFELLPITPRRLVSGLLAAGAVSPGAAGTFIGLAIATLATFPGWRLAPVMIAAVVVQLALCLVVARLVTTVLSNLLASRRTRELVTLAVALLIGLVALLPALLNSPGGTGSGGIEIASFDWAENLMWFPPGAIAASITKTADGETQAAAGLALYGTAATALIGAGWARSVHSMLVKAPNEARQKRRREEYRGTLAISPSWLRLPPGPVAGAVAKELRYLLRDNRVRAQLISSLAPMLVIAVVTFGSFSETPYAPFLAAGLAFFVALGALANQFGTDGGSFWAYIVSPAPLSTVILGKNIGWGLVTGPPVLVGATLLAWLSGDFSYLAAAVLGSLGVLLVSMAVGNVTSIFGAYRIPESNPFSTRGASGTVFFAVIIGMVASGVLLVPIAALIALPAVLVGPVGATVGAVLSIGYGASIQRLGMGLTSRLLVEREQSLLDVIDREPG